MYILFKKKHKKLEFLNIHYIIKNKNISFILFHLLIHYRLGCLKDYSELPVVNTSDTPQQPLVTTGAGAAKPLLGMSGAKPEPPDRQDQLVYVTTHIK